MYPGNVHSDRPCPVARGSSTSLFGTFNALQAIDIVSQNGYNIIKNWFIFHLHSPRFSPTRVVSGFAHPRVIRRPAELAVCRQDFLAHCAVHGFHNLAPSLARLAERR